MMAYIGNQQTEGFSQVPAKQDLTGATGTSLTLSHAVASAEGIDLFINNVRQEPTTAYSVIGTAVTLTGSVVASDDIYVVYNSLALQTTVPPDGSVTTSKLGNGAVTAVKLAAGVQGVAGITSSSTSGTALSIDANNIVLTPANPKFSIRLNASTSSNNYTSTSTSDVEFDTEEFDVGGCVAISSNVATFTALVTGYYQFNLSVTFMNPEGAGHVSTYLSIDGAVTDSSRNQDYRTLTDPQGGSYIAITSSHLIYLTANQTVNPRLHVHTDTSVAIRAGTRFSGFLVG